MHDRPLGQRFSAVYLDKGAPERDSAIIRNRIAAFFDAKYTEYSDKAADHLLIEIGHPMPGSYSYIRIREFIKTAPLTAFLDTCTELSKFFYKYTFRDNGKDYKAWIGFLQRAFTEGNSQFEVDDAGGIHPRIDAAYRGLEISAVRDLGKPRYAAALSHYEAAQSALAESAGGTGRAIREMQLAVEDVFKLVCPKASRLEPTSIEKELKPLVAKRLSGPELDATNQMLKGFGVVATASHQYRHGQGAQAAPASLDLAVAMITAGTAFLRWLIAFDQSTQQTSPTNE